MKLPPILSKGGGGSGGSAPSISSYTPVTNAGLAFTNVGSQTPSPTAMATTGMGTQNAPSQLNKDTRVYVLESDITATQNKVSTVEARSKY